MGVKLLLFTFYLNGRLHAVSTEKPNLNRISVFCTSLMVMPLIYLTGDVSEWFSLASQTCAEQNAPKVAKHSYKSIATF